jgi:hypothetical protein
MGAPPVVEGRGWIAIAIQTAIPIDLLVTLSGRFYLGRATKEEAPGP